MFLAKSPRKRLNAAERRELKAAALNLFVRQIGRKAQRGVEPNDRKFDRKTLQAVRHMKPAELDQFLRDGAE
jgi:ribosomal protein S20